MRKTLVLFVLVLAGAWARPSLAACPGTSACVYNKGCPRGSTQVKPGQSIQKAIKKAPCTGATICVAPGTYNEKIDFLGKPINLISSGGPTLTILNGSSSGTVVTFQTAEGKDSILDGFTVREGKALYGAGILIRNASPTIRNCIVRQNTATGGLRASGGGIGVTGVQAHPSITCTQFLGNVAGYEGGGLESTYSANPYLRSNLFEGNKAPYGAAIGVHWSGRLDLGWTQLLANQASVDGGGIHAGVPYGNVLVRQTWFKSNKAGSNGGGMWVAAGLADVINCTFDGNQAAQGGGIAAGFGSMVNVASTLFVQNKTTSGGSAALVEANGSNTSVVNHYNGFFGNTGGDYLGTYGDLGLLFLDPQLNACCPGPGSPAINAGIPDLHFSDPNGSPNDMGACGGPALSTYGPMQ
jgi:predicted outer membrane repeat protein